MKNLSTNLKLISVILLTGMLGSCTKDYYEPIETLPPPAVISYKGDMQPFFDAECVSCHNGGGIPLNLNPAVSYDNLINGGFIDLANPASSSLYTKIIEPGSMAKYTSPGKSDLTLSWIEQGALNN